MVGREPHDLRTGSAGGNVVFLVTRDGRDGKALCIVDAGLALAVNDIIYGAVISAVEYAHIEQVLAEEGLVLNLGDAVFAVLAYDYDFRKVGTVADVGAVVVALESYAHEAFCQVGGELGVVVDDLGGSDGLEARKFGKAREVLAVFLLEALEPVDSVAGDVVDVCLHGGHLFFQTCNLFLHGFHVELGNLTHRLRSMVR